MIYFVEQYNPDMRYQTTWRDHIVPHIRNCGFDCEVVKSRDSLTIHKGLWGEFAYKNSQFDSLFELRFANKINEGDTFVFCDAWNLNALYFKLITQSYDYKVNMIGIWQQGGFDTDSQMRQMLLKKGNTSWLKITERALSAVYDYNCFFDDINLRRFSEINKATKEGHNKTVIGQPIGTLKQFAEDTYKDKRDLIVFPYSAESKGQREIFNAIQSDFPQWEFVFCNDHRTTRSEYIKLLSQAKLVFGAGRAISDPTLLFEALLFDCNIIAPDIGTYKRLLPEEYLFPYKYLKPPTVNFMRNREPFEDLVGHLMKDYEDTRELREATVAKLSKSHYNDQGLLHILKQVINTDE